MYYLRATEQMIYCLIFSILMSFGTHVVAKSLSNECIIWSNITAITSFKNGTVFVASHQSYWLLNVNTMKPINDKSSGLIKDLIPGMNSVTMAVSLRWASDTTPTEIILFQTYEDSRYKYMAYMKNKWENGEDIVKKWVELAFGHMDNLHSKPTLLLSFRDEKNPTVFVLYDTRGQALNVPFCVGVINPQTGVKECSGVRTWRNISSFRGEVNSIGNKVFHSLWFKDPEKDTPSYMVFVDDKYYECNITTENNTQTTVGAKEVCDVPKHNNVVSPVKNIAQLFNCLVSVTTIATTTQKAKTKPLNTTVPVVKPTGSGKTFMIVVIVLMVLAFIVLFFIIYVYCKCLKSLIALESEKEKSGPKVAKPFENSFAFKEPKNETKAKSEIVSEIISNAGEKKVPDNQSDKNSPKPAMNERVNQIKGILEKSKKKEDKTSSIPKPHQRDNQRLPKKESQEEPNTSPKQHKSGTQRSPKKEPKEEVTETVVKEPQKRQFAAKDKKFQKNVKTIGHMLSNHPKKGTEQTIKSVTKVKPTSEEKVAKSEVQQTPAQSQAIQTSPQSRGGQTTEDRLRLLLSQTSSANDNEDRAKQILSTSSNAGSKQQDSRVEKLFKE